MSEHLPCPFCGGEVDAEGWLNGDGERGPECETCGSTAPSIRRWNTRLQVPPTAAPSPLAIGDHVEWQGYHGVVMTSPAVFVQFFDKYGSKKAGLSIPLRDLSLFPDGAAETKQGCPVVADGRHKIVDGECTLCRNAVEKSEVSPEFKRRVIEQMSEITGDGRPHEKIACRCPTDWCRLEPDNGAQHCPDLGPNEFCAQGARETEDGLLDLFSMDIGFKTEGGRDA